MSEQVELQEKFRVRSLGEKSKWITFHREYYRDLGRCMEDLQTYQAQVEAALPPEVREAFRSGDYPEASRICKRRNATMRAIILFSAMTAEATVNYYGARRFGAQVFAEYFERLDWMRKVKTVLLLGEGIRILKGHPLVPAAEGISRIRGDLVHPKAQELPPEHPTVALKGGNVVDTANHAIAACNAFLDEFTKFIEPGTGIDPREA